MVYNYFISEAKKNIDKIDKLFEIDTMKKKTKIVRNFVEFYKQYSSLNESISYDFEVSKTDLKEI